MRILSERAKPPHAWGWVAVGLLLVVALVVLIVEWRPLYEFVAAPDRIRDWVADFGVAGPLAIVLLEAAQSLLAPIPGQAIGAVSGYLYGVPLGTLYALIGVALGSWISFFLARRYGRPLVVRWLGAPSAERLDDLVRRGGTLFFFLIWLLPFVPDDLACVAAGLTAMPPRQFLFLMLAGRWPGVLASVWVGANASRLSPWAWGSLFVGLALLGVILWRWGLPLQEAILNWIERRTHRRNGSSMA